MSFYRLDVEILLLFNYSIKAFINSECLELKNFAQFILKNGRVEQEFIEKINVRKAVFEIIKTLEPLI